MATPVKNFRCPDDVWEAAAARAKEEGISVSAVVVEALDAYGSRRRSLPPVARPAVGETERSADA